MPARDILNLPGYDMPVSQYAPSPYYAGAQEELTGLGVGLLRGEVPEAYKPLTEIGGPAFEDVIRGVRTDIEKGVTAQAARLGQRGGAPLEVTGREMARVTPGLRWGEMMRGIESKRGLLGLGAELTTGVRGAGLQEAGQRQTFQLNLTQMGLSERQFREKLTLNKEQFTATLEEERRQFGENLKYKVETREITQDQFNQEMAFKDRQLQMQQQMWEQQIAQQEAQAKGQMWGDIIGGVTALATAPMTGGTSLFGLGASKLFGKAGE